jgi:two-component system chemotaxis sensor kinase CheA
MSQAPVSVEFERFRQTFFEECSEMLADMEERLSRLQSDGLDLEELNAVFRAVHSIKAGAGAFNYSRLVQFTHTFEYLLDRLRDGRMILDGDIGNLIIQSADILSEMVAAAREERDLAPDFEIQIHATLKNALGEGESQTEVKTQTATMTADQTAQIGWLVDFKPKPQMFRHANEPLLLIRELKSLGECQITTSLHSLPSLEALKPEDAYLSFYIKLRADVPESRVYEVFEFVDGDADITIEPWVLATGPLMVDEDEQGFGFFDQDPLSQISESEAAAERFGVNETIITKSPNSPTRQSQSNAQNTNGGQAGSVQSIRVELNRVDRLVNTVGELVIAQAMLRQEIAVLTETVLTQGQGLHANESLDSLEALTRELQDCVMAIRMQPVKSVFSRMPRLVREVAGKLNKHVRLVMIGEHTELDKTVIEELADPLTHMIRNSVDHGLESTEKRIELGKNPEGEIKLTAAHVGSNILIHIEDDGAGINRERVYNKAIEKGIIAAGAKLTDDEICELIFAPGFSTAAAVTDVSGRGVGMDVVRRNIMKIGGRIHISSVEGKGSRFTLVIPLTLAVLDGMLLAVGKERYILPLTSIIESFVPTGDQLRPLVGGGTLVAVRGDYYRLVRLNTIFGVSHSQSDPTKALIVLVETASGGRIGLLVDELIGQQQVVIKSLKENYIPVPGLSGATILGDGRVALILDIEQLGKLSDQHLKGLDPVEIPELSVPQIHAA